MVGLKSQNIEWNIPTFYQTPGKIFGSNRSKISRENRGIKWVIRVLNYVNDRFKAHHTLLVNTAQWTVTWPLYWIVIQLIFFDLKRANPLSRNKYICFAGGSMFNGNLCYTKLPFTFFPPTEVHESCSMYKTPTQFIFLPSSLPSLLRFCRFASVIRKTTSSTLLVTPFFVLQIIGNYRY